MKNIYWVIAIILLMTTLTVYGCTSVKVQQSVTTVQTSTLSRADQVQNANAEVAEVATAGKTAASKGYGRALSIPGFTSDATVLAEIAPYIQGTLKGDYYINADGTVNVTTHPPTYPNLTFDSTSSQFK